MLLTYNDYIKIRDWLLKNSDYIKDTEFPETNYLTFKDEIVFLQDNLNKKLPIDDFSKYLLNLNTAQDKDIDLMFI